jgi:hypothetical protein
MRIRLYVVVFEECCLRGFGVDSLDSRRRGNPSALWPVFEEITEAYTSCDLTLLPQMPYYADSFFQFFFG